MLTGLRTGVPERKCRAGMALHFLFTICSLIARTHICDPGKYVYICSGARFPAGGCRHGIKRELL